MSGSLFDTNGQRKYLVAGERRAFVEAASRQNQLAAAFCLTLAISGARISEVLALTQSRIDRANGALVFETLKRRKRGVYRAVPVPEYLLDRLWQLPMTKDLRIWPWCRTTAWSIVKEVMQEAGVAPALSKPRALRHAFGVDAGQKQVPLNLVQRWLGHARIETTAIYSEAIGEEERNLARRLWEPLVCLGQAQDHKGTGCELDDGVCRAHQFGEFK